MPTKDRTFEDKVYLHCDDDFAEEDEYTDTKFESDSWFIVKADDKDRLVLLIKGVLDGYMINVNDPLYARVHLLHLAARNSSPRLVELFLRHEARTDVKFSYRYRKEDNGKIPLTLALEGVRRELLELNLYSPGQSIFQLIVCLCLPAMRWALSTAMLLAWSSKKVAKEAYHCAMKGKLIELAVLLIVARERVLVPVYREDGARLRGSMTLHQCVISQISSLFHEFIKLTGVPELGKFTQIRGKMMLMSSTAMLLEVFQRAGPAIEEYLQLQQPDVQREQVEKDVSIRLEEAGCKLKDGDCDFSIQDLFRFDSDAVKTPIKDLKTSIDKSPQLLTTHLPVLPQADVFSLTREKIFGNGQWLAHSTHPLQNTYGLSIGKSINGKKVAKSISRSHYSTSLNVPVDNRTKALAQNVPKCLSREKLPAIAMMIKRWIRSA
ncbi:hypothetical protein Vadar_024060 [Vaccinium darrowii]|uniref:Uncharacterized protein n=1 Tax=Vaccinium darrowii TaxID=229202 RepID=A0ACB7YXW8_9ERIC|nr:hypothetical protein Vadar_024060 [Vaccinium darrowii]